MALSMTMNLLFCTTSMHRKILTHNDSYAPFDLEELDESESFVEFRFGKRDIRILRDVLQIPDTITGSQNVAGHGFRCF